MTRSLLLGVMLALVQPAVAAPRTIVGSWAVSAQSCTVAEERVVIRPLAITSPYMICEFADVRRDGTTVTWAGHCFDPDGSRRPATGNDGQMTATETAEKLVLRGLGMELGPLQRCR